MSISWTGTEPFGDPRPDLVYGTLYWSGPWLDLRDWGTVWKSSSSENEMGKLESKTEPHGGKRSVTVMRANKKVPQGDRRQDCLVMGMRGARERAGASSGTGVWPAGPSALPPSPRGLSPPAPQACHPFAGLSWSSMQLPLGKEPLDSQSGSRHLSLQSPISSLQSSVL